MKELSKQMELVYGEVLVPITIQANMVKAIQILMVEEAVQA